MLIERLIDAAATKPTSVATTHTPARFHRAVSFLAPTLPSSRRASRVSPSTI